MTVMWGIVPAAGIGSRIQPLAFSKELLPVGSRLDNGVERPCAVSEYLVERMIRGGADKICFVISPGKSDIMEYYGAGYGDATIAYVVQPQLAELPDDVLSFLLFPVEHPEFFDAVVLDESNRVREIQVKQMDASSHWIWGAFKMPGHVLKSLETLWTARNGQDEYFGTLVNAYLAAGGQATGIKAGLSYVDVGTLHGYRSAIGLLSDAAQGDSVTGARVALGWPAGRTAGFHDVNRE
jgi:dTDP-glucose pyrophosphorylase